MNQVYDPNTEILEPITGDFEETRSIQSCVSEYESQGSSTTLFNKMALGHPMIRYKEFVIEADVYGMGENLSVNIICPRCRHSLNISTERKAISYNHETGSISIEPFQCTWELDDERKEFGLSLCKWRVGVDNNIAIDA